MKLTAKIAASYFGAMVRTPDGDYRMHHVAPNLMCIEVETGNQFDYVAYDQCQLILTPLDKISDEDAVEVCKFLYSNPALHNPERGKSVATVGDWHSTRKGVEVIDYLRSKGYDCGHGSIPSLIAAGVAVEKEIV